MKQERPYPKAIITKKGEASVKNGHPWIYEGEVISADEHENGCIVDAFGEKGNWLGAGFISDNSRIRVRLLSDNPNDKFDGAFFARRVGYAVIYRKTLMRFDFECCRLIFGEAHGLPGVTVDRYGDLLVAEILSVGAERVKEHIYSALLSLIPGIRGIYERNESPLRVLEGIPQYKGWYGSAAHPVAGITENGILYDVDVENGQKTGFFLDQKYNRLAVARICGGMTVLDCFTHTGSFALNALKGGAKSVTAVDVSEFACEAVKKSKKLLCSQVKIGSQVKQIVSGIKAHYSPEEMVGKKVMVLVNLKPAKLAGLLSEGMLLCAEDENGELALMVPEKKMPSGAEIC